MSERQEMILALVPKVSASFGIPCELFLMYLVYGDHVKKRANPMLRALFGVSFFGFCDAIGWFLSSWAVPAGTFALSAGNQATCNFQGFLLQFVIGAPFYNCALAYFFYDVIVNERSFDDLLRKERYIHAGIISYALFTSVLLLSLGQYNPTGNICWTNGLPNGCGNSVYIAEPDAPDCERGDWAWVLCMVFFYIPLWCCILLILYYNFAIWMKLRNTTEGRWFATQSTLYAVSFCATWMPSTVWSIALYNNTGGFGKSLASAIFEPSAGVWNISIFLRNRHSIRRKMYNLLCCKFHDTKDIDSKLDDIEGAPREPRRPKQLKDSNVSTVAESVISSDKKKHKTKERAKDSNASTVGESVISSDRKKQKTKERTKDSNASTVGESVISSDRKKHKTKERVKYAEVPTSESKSKKDKSNKKKEKKVHDSELGLTKEITFEDHKTKVEKKEKLAATKGDQVDQVSITTLNKGGNSDDVKPEDYDFDPEEAVRMYRQKRIEAARRGT